MSAAASTTRQADLRLAYDRASQAYEAARNRPQSSPEDQLFIDLSLSTVEALDCFKSNSTLPVGCILRMARYAYFDAETPLLKLGYALTMLLNELLTERLSYVPTASSSMEQVPSVPSTVPSDPTGGLAPTSSVNKGARNVDHQNPHVDFFKEPSTPSSLDVVPRRIPDAVEPVKEEIDEAGTSGSDPNQLFQPTDAMPFTLGFGDNKLDSYDDQDDFEDADNEPIVDLYCPTTGESRPFDPNFMHDMGAGSSGDADQFGFQPQIVVPGASTSTRTPHRKRARKSNQIDRCETCHLCGKTPRLFERTPSSSLGKARAQFLDRIILTCQVVEDRVYELRSNSVIAQFCLEHIALPLSARNSKSNLSGGNEILENLIKKSSCDLCEHPRYPLRVTPHDPTHARLLCNYLKDLTDQEKGKIESMISQWKQATICQKHF